MELIASALVFMATVSTVTSSLVIGSDPSPDGVQEIMLPMCRGFLPYNVTRLPNSFGHVTQAQVYRDIEHHWAYMDYGCSKNFRLFVCSLFLPKYDPSTQTNIGPCKETCNRARNRCKAAMKQTKSRWPKRFKCGRLPRRKKKEACIAPTREKSKRNQHTYCVENKIPMCRQFNVIGSLPNFFMQRSVSEITTEMKFYENLIASGCNENLTFFLCGTYMPFCIPHITPFATPCRELCEQVRSDCEGQFFNISRGLPWPNKLQCHRYVNSDDSARYCSMPGDF